MLLPQLPSHCCRPALHSTNTTAPQPEAAPRGSSKDSVTGRNCGVPTCGRWFRSFFRRGKEKNTSRAPKNDAEAKNVSKANESMAERSFPPANHTWFQPANHTVLERTTNRVTDGKPGRRSRQGAQVGGGRWDLAACSHKSLLQWRVFSTSGCFRSEDEVWGVSERFDL